jgi:hypothetical protein
LDFTVAISDESKIFCFPRRNGSPRTHTQSIENPNHSSVTHTTLESVGGLRVHFTFVRRCPAAPCGHSRRTHGIGVVSLSFSLPYLIIIIFIGSRDSVIIIWALRPSGHDRKRNEETKRSTMSHFREKKQQKFVFFFPSRRERIRKKKSFTDCGWLEYTCTYTK